MTDLERLTTALEFLKANDWTKGYARAKTLTGYAYCAEGAVRYGVFPELAHCEECPPNGPGIRDILNKLDRAVEKVTEYKHDELYEYNDVSGTTKEDMVKVFEKAIEMEKAFA